MWNIYLVCFVYFLTAIDVVRCKPDYLFSYGAGGWLKLHTMPATWEEAFVRCNDEGAVLASPLNKELASALHTQMILFSVTGHLFLGTHDLYSNGDYFSVEGVPLSDMEVKFRLRYHGNHSPEAPSPMHPSRGLPSHGNGDCLTLSADEYTHYSSCKDTLPYVCYKKLDKQIINECGTFDNDYHLNQSTGSCYKVHREEQSWTRAYRICAAEGGHLVILNDDEEAGVVKDLIPVRDKKFIENDRIHVGIVFWSNERVWTTVYGQRLQDVYNNNNKWNGALSNDMKGNQYRGVFYRNGDLRASSLAETVKYPFVCEKSPISNRFEDFLTNME